MKNYYGFTLSERLPAISLVCNVILTTGQLISAQYIKLPRFEGGGLWINRENLQEIVPENIAYWLDENFLNNPPPPPNPEREIKVLRSALGNIASLAAEALKDARLAKPASNGFAVMTNDFLKDIVFRLGTMAALACDSKGAKVLTFPFSGEAASLESLGDEIITSYQKMNKGEGA